MRLIRNDDNNAIDEAVFNDEAKMLFCSRNHICQREVSQSFLLGHWEGYASLDPASESQRPRTR